MSFSKAGSHGKISASETSCSYNYATQAGNYYTALLTPAVTGNVCVVALDITFGGHSALSMAYGMAPDGVDLETAALFKQNSICVMRSTDAGNNVNGKVGSPWWVDMQKDGESGLPSGVNENVKGLLLVWRKSDTREHGEFAVFAPYMARDMGIKKDGLPYFRAVPAGCTRFAVTGVPGATLKVNQALADKAMEALKSGDAAFVEWIKETWASGSAGCCVIA